MTCEVVRAYLSDFIDKALPEETLSDIRGHIESCDFCYDLYDTLYAAERFYSAAAGRDVPEGFRETLRERMEDLVRDEQVS